MKTSYLMSLAVATVLLTGCGGASKSTTSLTGDTATSATSSNTIKVQRGPILGAKVVDVKGKMATQTAAGEYTFASAPSYPILVTGGVIDMDRNGKISLGDVVNDMNLSTVKGDVVTLLTTLAANANTKAEIDTLVNDLNLTQSDLYSKIPTDSKKIEAISNVIYKYVKENNLTNLLDTNTTLHLSSSVKTEYDNYIQDAGHSAKITEQKLVNALATKVTKLENDAEVSAKQEEVKKTPSQEELTKIKTHLSQVKSDYERENGDLGYKESGSTSYHNQGVSCAKCHSVSGSSSIVSSTFNLFESDDDAPKRSEGSQSSEGSENAFTSGATIFTALNAGNSVAKAAKNYSLRLVLAQSRTKINYRTGRGSGNVNATFTAGGVTKYTAQVLNAQGVVVNSSATDSHDASRFDCNKCHTAAGTNGAPGRIVSFSYSATPVTTLPTTQPTTGNGTTTGSTTGGTTTAGTTTTAPAKSFAKDVVPALNKCTSCHGNWGYNGVKQRVDTAAPASSILLQKGSGSISHGGGQQLSATEVTTIRDWISQGAKNN